MAYESKRAYSAHGNEKSTTFQSRGYLAIKCEPSYFISNSDKSISEQLKILSKISNIDSRGAVFNADSVDNVKYSTRYETPKELNRVSKPRINPHVLGTDQMKRLDVTVHASSGQKVLQ